MSLSDFPLELFVQIPPLLDKQDASRLSRTCKTIRHIVLPEVYQTIRWRWDKNFSPPIHLLLRSLMQKPRLGSYVEKVDFAGIGTNRWMRDDFTSPPWASEETLPKLADSEFQVLLPWIDHFHLTPVDEWSEALRWGHNDAYVSLLLAFLPNVRSLVLRDRFITNSQFIGSLFIQALSPMSPQHPHARLPQYTKLREVHLSPVTGEQAYYHTVLPHFSDMYTALYLPSLEDLTVTLPIDRQFQWPSETHRAHLANLTSLRLPSCNATEHVLDQLLSIKPPLKELLYDYCCAVNITANREYFFDTDILSHALNHVQDTLESLTLSIDLRGKKYEFFYTGRGCIKGSPISFHQFSRLTFIEVPFVLLFGWDRITLHECRLSSLLPRSVKDLCLTGDMEDSSVYEWEPDDWLQRVQGLLSDWEVVSAEKATSLQLLEMKRENLRWEEEDRINFENMCQAFGIPWRWTAIESFGSHGSDFLSIIFDRRS